MNIPWKFKSRCFRAIDFWRLDPVLYFLQKHVTKRSRVAFSKVDSNWLRHREVLEAHKATGFVFEFGAGKTLAQNLYLSSVVDKQLVVDMNAMLDIRLVEETRRALQQFVGLRTQVEITGLTDLSRYGITYAAPFNAASTSLPDNSVDACVSTNTLEHIPPLDIKRILNELRRIVKTDGVISAKIDYSDHYSHTDSSISVLNFLAFSEEEWARHNHNSHYQNRLRHLDYCELFSHCGFSIEIIDLVFPQSTIPEHISERFRGENPSWQATSAHFVLQKQ